jgi:hypothetical protein
VRVCVAIGTSGVPSRKTPKFDQSCSSIIRITATEHEKVLFPDERQRRSGKPLSQSLVIAILQPPLKQRVDSGDVRFIFGLRHANCSLP